MRRWGWHIPIMALLVGVAASAALAVERFPPPDFDTGHVLPRTAQPVPLGAGYDYVDTAVLLAALVLATYLLLRRRSRRGIIALCVFGVVYFGFWRRGCVCSIGSVQNVALALFEPGYALPITVAAFFLLPIVFALFFGRVFCAGVCPMGAAQDLVLIKAVHVPRWLDHGLGVLPYIYLGLAVLLAATGSSFIICQYDPFVPLFRMTGTLLMLSLGAGFLVVGTVVGRPYCRFLCPYGAVLGLAARVSRWKVSIYPDVCVDCKLCAKSCPVNAIDAPAPHPGARTLSAAKRRLAWTVALCPILVLAGTLAVGSLAPLLARAHPDVQLARLVAQDSAARSRGAPGLEADELIAFRKTGRPAAQVYADAEAVRHRFILGSRVLGAWIGLVLGLKLVSLARVPARTDYEANRGSCVGCGRCFDYCPKEYQRQGTVVPAPVAVSVAGRATADTLAPGRSAS
jgi:ferredoxin